MLDRRAAMMRRVVRHRRHSNAWRDGLLWLNLLKFRPSRVPVHVTILSFGLVAALLTTVLNRPAVAPMTETLPPSAASVASDLPLEVSAAPAPQLEAAPGLTSYVVEAGDTLRSVAERSGVSVATIVGANGLPDPDLIEIGQELVILPASGVLHNLNPGETISQVAARYGVDAFEIARVNQVGPAVEAPVLGQKLVVPGIEPALPEPRPRPVVARTAPRPDEKTETTLANSISSGQAEAAASEKPARSPVSYEVQDGDTVRSLANQFGVSINTILSANNIDDPDLIKPGLKLKVLPVSGIEHEIDKGESLADIAAAYKVDMGPIIDFNSLANPDVLKVGEKIVIPGAAARVAVASAPAPSAPAAVAEAASRASAPVSAAAQTAPRTQVAAAAAAPAAPAAAPARVAVPAPVVGGSGAGVLKNAMNFVGYRYVFGGSSPAGFDCSGFVWYVHKIAGIDISRGLWGQLNGGPRISRENLVPGDTVFFANTYMPGLSHVGIYVGGGNFVNAIDEGSGVGISSLGSSYWASRYIGAARLWQ